MKIQDSKSYEQVKRELREELADMPEMTHPDPNDLTWFKIIVQTIGIGLLVGLCFVADYGYHHWNW